MFGTWEVGRVKQSRSTVEIPTGSLDLDSLKTVADSHFFSGEFDGSLALKSALV